MAVLRKAIVAGLALLALAASPAEAKKKEPAETSSAGGLIDNVNGYALDDQGTVHRFNGLLIDKAGKVAKLLQPGDYRPAWLDFRLDGAGRTLLPGLIDAHGHVMDLGLKAIRLDLSDTNSLAQAQSAVTSYAADHPAPPWIVGAGWNQERWGLGRNPTAADIDIASGDRPVVLERIDEHAILANTAAMREAGITAATKAPPGGRIERDAKGNPTGLFVDAAQDLIQRVVPPPVPRELNDAFDKAQDELLAAGLVGVDDIGTTVDDWNVYRRMGDAGRLRMRIVSYGLGLDTILSVGGALPTPWLYGDKLRMIGMVIAADGALGSRGAWLKRDYADASGQTGLQRLDDAKIRNLMSRAAMDNFQVAVEATGDAANAQTLAAIEELVDTYHGDFRWRIEHAQIVDPADLPRFAHNGIVASMQPAQATSDWRMAEARLGQDRLRGAYAWRSMLDENVPLAFGSGFPVESPNPFAGIAAAISRTDEDGQPAGGWHPEQKLTLTEALLAFTHGAAYAGHGEDRTGSLMPGHDADFILIDRDIMRAGMSADDIRATQVLETWIGGIRAWVRK